MTAVEHALLPHSSDTRTGNYYPAISRRDRHIWSFPFAKTQNRKNNTWLLLLQKKKRNNNRCNASSLLAELIWILISAPKLIRRVQGKLRFERRKV